MKAEEQAQGEAHVMALLFEPLEDLGLGRPTTLTIEKYEKMKRTVCQVLAARSEAVLTELKDWALAHPGGPNRDRVPVGAHLVEQAQKIMPEPVDCGPSPLMYSIFGHQLGVKAIEEGWAPELMNWLKSRPLGERRWPERWTVSQIKDAAREPMRRFRDIEFRLADGREISPGDRAFRDRRRAAIRACEDIANSNDEKEAQA